MKSLYTKEQFENAKSSDKLPCECYFCKNTFYVNKKTIKDSSNPNKHDKIKFCSQKCNGLKKTNNGTKKVVCAQCNKEFVKHIYAIKKTKNNFCCKSCAATYNNKHKTTGTRRSKLEIWLESKLTSLYPEHKILFNDKTIINSELDIYFPELNLAFELNGIFHYEPIYGQDKLAQTQNNDINKFQACYNKKIGLCIIDTSKQSYFKESTSKKYLDIIIDIISKNQ